MIIEPDKAVELIRKGEVVAIPTETVYGLAADAGNAIAVKQTFKLKGRPPDNPLIVHLSDIKQISRFTNEQPFELPKLVKEFWPGPLTVILHKKSSVLDVVTGGLNTVALRMPDHEITREILDQTGPVTAPSANRSGRPSPTRPQHVLDDFGEDLPVVDGGTCKIGLESTVLDLTSDPYVILRPGQISAQQISGCIGRKITIQQSVDKNTPKSPGTRYTHYKPNAKVNWFDENQQVVPESALYIFHTTTPPEEASNSVQYDGDYSALARDLYDLYRTADQKKWDRIFIEPLPDPESDFILPALQNRIERSVSR